MQVDATAGAMEKSTVGNQPILDFNGDDGRFDREDEGVMMDVELRWAADACGSDNGFEGGPAVSADAIPTLLRIGRQTTMKGRIRWSGRYGNLAFLLVLIASLLIIPASAVFVEFQNCLSEGTQNNEPLELQWVPLFVDAKFDTVNKSHGLLVTVWGNITGSTVGTAPRLVLPPANDTEYWSGNSTLNGGKILDLPFPEGAAKYTTLSNKVNVLTYEPYSKDVEFCNYLINGTCPLGPRFNVNA